MVDHPKRRWLPAFSIRTLLIVTTLLCAYAACWWPTKTQGVRDVGRRPNEARTSPSVDTMQPFGDASAVAPLVVRQDVMDISWFSSKPPRRRYYFWFFGYIVKLPYEQTISDDASTGDKASPDEEAEDSGLIDRAQVRQLPELPSQAEDSMSQSDPEEIRRRMEFFDRLRRNGFGGENSVGPPSQGGLGDKLPESDEPNTP